MSLTRMTVIELWRSRMLPTEGLLRCWKIGRMFPVWRLIHTTGTTHALLRYVYICLGLSTNWSIINFNVASRRLDRSKEAGILSLALGCVKRDLAGAPYLGYGIDDCSIAAIPERCCDSVKGCKPLNACRVDCKGLSVSVYQILKFNAFHPI
jgi:hypothetical protein